MRAPVLDTGDCDRLSRAYARRVRDLLAVPLESPRGGPAAAPRTLVTYSPKVFVPLTTLCRDVCGYCTFARPPRRGERAT